MTHYEVLIHLYLAPDNRLRMSEPGRVGAAQPERRDRLVDRLDGPATSFATSAPTTGGSSTRSLTDRGRARLMEARPTHLAGVRARFLAHFDNAELDELAAAWERVQPGITE